MNFREKVYLLFFFLLSTTPLLAADITFLNEFSLAQVNKNKANPSNILSRPGSELRNILFFDHKQDILHGNFRLTGRLRADFSHQNNEFDNDSKFTNEYGLDINEIFYNYVTENYLVSLGRKKVKWGVAYVASPTDLVSPSNLLNDTDDRLHSLQGSDLAQFTLYGGDSQLDVYILPRTSHNQNFIDSPTVATRLYKYLHPFDVSLVSRVQEDGDAYWGGNTAVTIGDGLELHGEYVSGKVTRALLGGQWSPNKDMNVIVEYFHLSDGASKSEWGNYQNTLDQINLGLNHEFTRDSSRKNLNELAFIEKFPLRKEYIFSRFLKKRLYKEIDVELATLVGLNDGSFLQQSTVTLKVSNSIKAYIRLLSAFGDKGTEFDQFPNNNQLLIGTVVKI